MMEVYFPTRWGDVSIVEEEPGKTVVKTTELTSLEELRVKELLEHYEVTIPDILANQRVEINQPLKDVHKTLKKILKKGKPTLTAIKLKDGRMELVEEFDERKFEKAVTVEKARPGCPMPTLTERKEMHASRVLKEFLTPAQLTDYEKRGMLIARGNHSGLPYLITSRWSPDIERYGRLFDLVNQKVICANSGDLPPSEEVLSLKLSVELNEREFLFN